MALNSLCVMHRERSSIVAISCVRNEADIVEAFVRHTLSHCDRMLIVDHGSTDATGEILRSLVDEGLPLEVTVDLTPTRPQSDQMTALARSAAEDPGAAWILPVDADEFVVTEKGASLRDLLSRYAEPLSVPWVTYCPSEFDDLAELNPAVRLTMRREREPRLWTKILFPSDIAHRAFVETGNHNVVVDGHAARRRILDGVALAHLPIRNSDQWVRKVAIGAFRWRAVGDEMVYNEYRLLESDPEGFAAGFRSAAMRYALRDGDDEVGLVRDPLPYGGGPLLYTQPPREGEPWRSILEYASALARQIGETRANVAGRLEPSTTQDRDPLPGPLLTILDQAAAAATAHQWEAAAGYWSDAHLAARDRFTAAAYRGFVEALRCIGHADTAFRVAEEGLASFPGDPGIFRERERVLRAWPWLEREQFEGNSHGDAVARTT